MGKSLITGGAGMVGRQLARLLLARGDEVVLLDIAPAAKLPADIRDRVSLVRADLSDWAQVMDAVNSHSPETIYHIGALMPPASEQNHTAAWGINVNGTMHIFEAARQFGVRTVVYSSTTATFPIQLPEPVPNDHAQLPVTLYGVTKVCSERLGEYYHRRYGLDFRGVRFLSILGPGRIPGFGWSAYTSLVVEECAKGNPYVIKVNELLQLRFIYVKDAALSLMKLADADGSRLSARVYNLDGFSASTKELVEAVTSNVPDARISWEFDPEYQRVMDTQYGNIQHRMDDSLARRDWDWTTSYTLPDAVRDFVEDVRRGRT
ncbi:MAG: NAD-dependent epimerase/dehydratase family protein [Dehalococcoidia bacterium]|nr:NAD-dependent epimerase/dehydratase family protein [Dehalococcoidia bacterium]